MTDFVHVRTWDQFLVRFSHVMVSIDFHCENRVENRVENQVNIWELFNTGLKDHQEKIKWKEIVYCFTILRPFGIRESIRRKVDHGDEMKKKEKKCKV